MFLRKKSVRFFVHRFIFSNKSEIKFEFCECSLKIESASAKDYIKNLAYWLDLQGMARSRNPVDRSVPEEKLRLDEAKSGASGHRGE